MIRSCDRRVPRWPVRASRVVTGRHDRLPEAQPGRLAQASLETLDRAQRRPAATPRRRPRCPARAARPAPWRPAPGRPAGRARARSTVAPPTRLTYRSWLREVQAAAPAEHGDQQRQPVGGHAHERAPGHADARRRDERLDLDEDAAGCPPGSPRRRRRAPPRRPRPGTPARGRARPAVPPRSSPGRRSPRSSRSGSWRPGAAAARRTGRPPAPGPRPRGAPASAARRGCRPWSRGRRGSRACRARATRRPAARPTRAPGRRIPAGPSRPSAVSVWTESTTSSPGASALGRRQDGVEVGLREHLDPRARRRRRSGPAGRPGGGAGPPIPRPRHTARPCRRRRPLACRASQRATPAAISSTSVDLPMPGSPPSSTRAPGTRPPPRTRSTSPMPTLRRGAGPRRHLTQRARRRLTERGRPDGARRRCARADAGATVSTSESHVPQTWHRPSQARRRGAAGLADVAALRPRHASRWPRRASSRRPARWSGPHRATGRRRWSGRRCTCPAAAPRPAGPRPWSG